VKEIFTTVKGVLFDATPSVLISVVPSAAKRKS
jgi:hypothetical protein